MTEIITYRISSTGVWGYEFYDSNRDRVGFISAVVSSSAPVRIESKNYRWYSRFDMDTTVIPGIDRRVMDNQTGQEVYRLIYWHREFYQARSLEESVGIEIRNGAFLFGNEGMPVIAMTEKMDQTAWIPRRGADAEAFFRTTFYEDVSEPFALMALSFPALRFY